MNQRGNLVHLCGVCLCATLCLGAAPSQDTTTFLESHAGARGMMAGGNLVALYGVTFATDSLPGTSTDDFVAQFLQENAAVFGVDSPDYRFAGKVTVQGGTSVVYTYGQFVEGLTVYATSAKIAVRLGAEERISYVGLRLVQSPPQPLPADLITGAAAVAVVQNPAQYGYLANFSMPQKVVYLDSSDALHRAWSFTGDAAAEAYLFFVDTNTAELVGVVDQVFEAEAMLL